MKFITARELRVEPGKVWKLLRKEQDLVVTSHGQPIALLNGIKDGDFEDTLKAVQRVRTFMALEAIRKQAKATGLDKMTLKEINQEIEAVRRQRRH